MDLFEAADRRRSSPLIRAFLAFHADNPEVYRLFDRFTRQVIAAGHQHYSSDAILHRVRWHTSVETTGHSYKINNNFSAYYARLWMRNNPRYDGFFRCRAVDGDLPEEAAA